MFYSQCLLSRNGSLRAIWVAAYFHKKLKKEKIAQTDISSSVDEIVLNEYTVTYRVPGYLLLGVDRIYSKKVEYLFVDCQDCLVRINMYKKDKLPKQAMEKSTANEQTLEEAWEVARNAYFLDKYQEDGTASFASSSHNAPIEDPLLSLAVDNLLVVYLGCSLSEIPNKLIKQSIYDLSSLVFKRKKAPVTALGTWRAYTVPKLFWIYSFKIAWVQDLQLLLITGCLWLEDLFYQKKYMAQQVEADKGCSKSAEKVLETQSKYSEQHVDMEESYVDPSPSAFVGLVKCTTSRVSGKNGAEFFSRSEAEKTAATEIPDLGLSLTEIGQHEEHHKSGELSVSTRKMAKYLSESFQSKKEQKEVLSLEPILEGRTRRGSAKLFHEILQEAPYGDIVVMPATLQTEENL
ncbi:hypothetical protein MKX01_033961 [Papaver californicum]|nr:hypothetical protein MKX01_033961 [Papaver californicum]